MDGGRAIPDDLRRVRAALDGDSTSLEDLLEAYRERLRRMVRLRMDPRIRARVDPSDVIQEAYIDVTRQLSQYAEDPRIPFFFWVRFLTARKLQRAHRQHLGAGKRDAAREVRLGAGSTPSASSIILAEALADSGPSPSGLARVREDSARVVAALDALRSGDREILALRHAEQLSNAEIAGLLGITAKAAQLRYIRAIRRLRDRLRVTDGGATPSAGGDEP